MENVRIAGAENHISEVSGQISSLLPFGKEIKENIRNGMQHLAGR